MRHFAVHEEPSIGGPHGVRRLIVPFRRLLVRVLRPIFLRLAGLLEALDADQRQLDARQARMARQLDMLLNHGWDQAALLRRVAALERQVEKLSAQAAKEARPCPAD